MDSATTDKILTVPPECEEAGAAPSWAARPLLPRAIFLRVGVATKRTASLIGALLRDWASGREKAREFGFVFLNASFLDAVEGQIVEQTQLLKPG
ncbi:hypothetical protein Efla_001337 [Eimeria flavescens]